MNKNIIKPLVFSIVFLLASILFGLVLSGALEDNDLSINDWINVAAAIILFAAAFSLFSLNSFKNEYFNLIVWILVPVICLFFSPVKNIYIVLSIFLFVGVLFLGKIKIIASLKENFQLNFFEAARKGSRWFFEGLLIFIIVVYYFSGAGSGFKEEVLISKPMFDKIFSLVTETSVDNKGGLLGAILGGQVPVEVLKSKEFAKMQKTMADQIYNSINDGFKSLVGPYKKYLPIIFAFGFYLAMRFFAGFARLIASIISWLIIKLLFLFGVMKIKVITTEREYFE